jgi:hypothetical protein
MRHIEYKQGLKMVHKMKITLSYGITLHEEIILHQLKYDSRFSQKPIVQESEITILF